jgi:hypothetical protein
MLHMWTTQRTWRYPEVPWLEMQYERQIGRPKGLFSALPGLGIQTRRTGCALIVCGVRSRVTRSGRRAAETALTPSTPASVLPLVVLRDPPHGETAGGLRLHQETLQAMDRLDVATG